MTYKHEHHARIEGRKAHGPATHKKAARSGKRWLGRVGAVVGLRITLIVGTMTVATGFTALALVSLPSALKSHDKIIIVAWIAQTFIQLVLLPIIIVGQNVGAAASDARARDTYDDAEAILHELVGVHRKLEDMSKPARKPAAPRTGTQRARTAKS